MQARIYQPSKNAMQSGRGKAGQWVLTYETETPRQPDPLMGWTSAGDTLNQVVLRFDTAQAAEAFAKTKGWAYTIQIPQERKVRPRSYADNFKTPPQDD